jgi:hypothetical protein
MRKIYVLAACFLMLVSGPVLGKGDNHDGFGLGILLGEHQGLSGKLWSGTDTAFDFGMAWSTSGTDEIAVHADYVLHEFDMIEVDKGALPFYYGIGVAYLGHDRHDDHVGARMPVGLDYLFADSAFDVFLEIVPVMYLSPDTEFELEIGIGGRFFF